VFENRVLRGIFGSNRKRETGSWARLHSQELHNLYSSQNITRVIKSRIMMGEACSKDGRDEKRI
jgi:hypothetical protein